MPKARQTCTITPGAQAARAHRAPCAAVALFQLGRSVRLSTMTHHVDLPQHCGGSWARHAAGRCEAGAQAAEGWGVGWMSCRLRRRGVERGAITHS